MYLSSYSPYSMDMFKNVYIPIVYIVWPFQRLSEMTAMKSSQVNERACTVRISRSK